VQYGCALCRDNEDAKSDVSSSSQTSYDPQKPNFNGSEISGLMAAEDGNSNNGNVVLLAHRSRPDTTCKLALLFVKH